MSSLANAARKLVDSISFDVNGALIGGQWRGGHGGLTSQETLKLGDGGRRELDGAERQEPTK